MTAPRTLAARLSRMVGLSTLAGLVAFVLVGFFVLWLDDESESDEPGAESTFDELIEHFALAVAAGAPVGLIVSVAGARWAARRETARIDRLVETAGKVSIDNLGFRLPVSAAGDELDALTEALNAVLERIDHGIAAQRRFAADASHELRTPLAVMVSALEVARRRPRDAAAWEQVVDDALVEARQLAALSEALLQISRVDADATAAMPIEVDAAVAAVVERWRPRAAAAEVELVATAATGATVEVEPAAFAVAIGNLIDNAIAWSPRGAAVHVELTATPTGIDLVVDDAGPGVPAAQRARIFEPFARGDAAAGRAGAGLGLAIVKRFCEASGGQVSVDTSPGGGARFVLRLPRNQADSHGSQ